MEVVSPVLTMTPEAVTKLKEILAEQTDKGMALRIMVESGGCSGLQYGMALDDQVRPDDQVIEQDGVKLVVDSHSADYVKGSEIDYVNELMGAGFTFHNPNAVKSCSCGHSFDSGDGSGNASGCCSS